MIALAHRPAPVQVAWLGYAGTTGAHFIDAVLADAIALPASQQAFYSEQIVHLPDSFFPMDTTRIIGPPPTRAEAGLPEDGFVFCGFNNNFKITSPPDMTAARPSLEVPLTRIQAANLNL